MSKLNYNLFFYIRGFESHILRIGVQNSQTASSFVSDRTFDKRHYFDNLGTGLLKRQLLLILVFLEIYLILHLTHNKNAYNLEYKIAETLMRRGKDFKSLYLNLYNLIN